MKPYYFGRSEKSLFGIHHPPQASRHDGGIVLCYPLGQEYIHGYRAFQQLAVHLARAGFAVLRFDYYGCGDSAGNAEEGSVKRWMDDIETALDEMGSSGKVSKLCLIGARMGAALSALVGSQRSDLSGLVLWDPVINGKDYVKDLMARHREWADGAMTRPDLPEDNGNLEALGFPLSHALRRELEQIDLLSLERRPARKVLVVEGGKTAASLRLSDRLKGDDGRSEYRHVSAPQVWSRRPGGENALVPMNVLQLIVSWMSTITP